MEAYEEMDNLDTGEEKTGIQTNFIKYDVKSVRKQRKANPLIKNKGKATRKWFDIDPEKEMNFTYNFVLDNHGIPLLDRNTHRELL